MGHYNRVTLKFKKLFKKKVKDYYLWYNMSIVKTAPSPKGVCGSINVSDTKLMHV